MARYRVRAVQIVVEVSDARREVYLQRGARLPDTATAASIARLVDRGLVVEVPDPTAAATVVDPAAAATVVEPETEVAPAFGSMTVEQLKAHLTGLGIPFDGVTAKADLLALAQQ